MKERVQSFGRFLSAMVMPNIGAFIAWGLIAALFIENGWFPNAALATMVGPMSIYLLPILIAFTGGSLVGDRRGGVAGAVAVMGLIAASAYTAYLETLATGVETSASPQFLGALVIGPLAGWIIKVFDRAMAGHVKAGFEMLVDNFSVGILAMITAIVGFFILSPIVTYITDILGGAVDFLVARNLLPLASIIVEPAKVLFLNNAINQGVFTPLGNAEVSEYGKSILFLIESNPGPGLGILLAYVFAGKGTARETAPGAIIIHFFGGIHEIFFPYVLMNPILLLAQIAGGMVGVFIENLMGVGLVGPASPGSIIAITIMTAPGSHLGMFLGVFAAAAVSCAVGIPLLKIFGKEEGDLSDAQEKMSSMKGGKAQPVNVSANPEAIKNIVFACDAGMGSSAMGATVLSNELKSVGRGDITVEHASVSSIPSHAQIVVTHQDLRERAENSAPQAEIVTITNFMNAPEYKMLAEQLSGSGQPAEAVVVEETPAPKAADNKSNDILLVKNIKTNQKAAPKEDIIRKAGQMLVDSGYVNPDYIDGMIAREDTFATNIGNGIAIPHGVEEAKAAVKKSGISVQTFPQTTEWGDSGPVKIVVGIAGVGDDHLDILARIATKLATEEEVDKLMKMSPEDIQVFFTTD